MMYPLARRSVLFACLFILVAVFDKGNNRPKPIHGCYICMDINSESLAQGGVLINRRDHGHINTDLYLYVHDVTNEGP